MKLLVVDDEPAMADAIRDNLEFEGWQADCAYGGNEALDALKAESYHLIILDVMMPDRDGFSVLEHLRADGITTPVIFLTARSAEADKLRGLGLGADDYMVKPFSILELIARVKAILKRARPDALLDRLQIGEATLNLAALTCTTPSGSHTLSRYEADILRLLASEPGRIFSREDLLDQIWGMHAFPSNRTVDNYIVKLRQKIEPHPKQPRYLTSVYGKGYKLTLSAEPH